MAESVIYADLRFVKTPLRKNVSHPGEESDEDGELTYENVQAPSDPEAPTSLALDPRPGGKTGHGHPCCSQHLFLGLLLTCLLLGVAAIWLGVRYLQVSQQFGQLSRMLEATNSSLQELLHLGTIQLEQKEKDLKASKEQSQRAHQAAQEQLQLCQAEKEKTQEVLHAVQQKLSDLQDTMKPFFTCPSQDTCCVVGWILIQRRCFHISLTKRDWRRSREYCKSLSSDLTRVTDTPRSYYYSESSPWKSLVSKLPKDTSYWVGHSLNKNSCGASGCSVLEYVTSWSLKTMRSSTAYACICEMASFRFPDKAYSV